MLTLVLVLSSLHTPALAQTTTTRATGDDARAEKAEVSPATEPPAEPRRVALQTGAPQPISQNQALPLSPRPDPQAIATIKLGANMILLYGNNFRPTYDPLGNKKKHLVDVWSAGIVLDGKVDRFGLHMEFRARDRSLGWSPVNTWFAELYAYADIIPYTNPRGMMMLKVGKSLMQFGRIWDNSFYGNIQLRDGLKLDSNWGLLLEWLVRASALFGVRGAVQYFVIDGQANTSYPNRDTPAIVSATWPGQPSPGPIGARKRDRFVVKLEPYFKKQDAMWVRVGASLDTFTADFPDTQSAARLAARSRIKDIDNKARILRYGADIAMQLAWFGAWGEWIHQDGAHTNAWPILPRADNPATAGNEARAGSASDDVTYFMAGGNVTYSRVTLQYNFSQGIYRNILALDTYPGRPPSEQPRLTYSEWIHNPSLQIKVSEQIRLIFETPLWFRKPLPGMVAVDPEQTTLTTGWERKELIEQQFLLTLHGRF